VDSCIANFSASDQALIIYLTKSFISFQSTSSSFMVYQISFISIVLAVAVPVVLGGQCTDDMAAAWIGNTQFSLDIANCAKANMGAGVGTSSCLKSIYSVLSPECSACFGETVSCGAKNCAGFCIGREFSRECLECTENAGCNAALAVCTGISEGPPVPSSITPNGASDITSTTTRGTMQMTMSVGSMVLMLVLAIAL
jgi:hypothetical protein